MTLGRASWIAAVVTCAIAAVGTFVAGYAGYGVTFCAVGLAASVNLLPRGAGTGSGSD